MNPPTDCRRDFLLRSIPRSCAKIIPAVALAVVTSLLAQVPPLINYQGRVAVDGTNFEGTGQFKFALVNADGTETFWSNDGTSEDGSEPANAVPLSVSKGLYSVLLGDAAVTNMIALPVGIFTNPDVRLRVWFNDGVNGSQLLAPDQRLAPMAYLADGAVQSQALAASAVQANHIASGAVGRWNVAPNSLDFLHLNVPAYPQPGQVMGFDGNGLVWTTPTGGGSGPWATVGSTVYYNGGFVGLGTDTPMHLLSLRNGPGWTSSFWKGALELDNASAIGWQSNSGGQRFGMGHTNGSFLMFRTTSDPGTTATPPIYDFAITDAGNVGIGSVNPQSKLEVRAASPGYGITHGDGSVTVGSFINLDGGWLGTKSNHALHLFVNDGASALTIDQLRRVGIGTPSPLVKLHVAGHESTWVEAAVQNTGGRAILALNSRIGNTTRVWTLESGVNGDAGKFGIFDRQANRERLTIDTDGTVTVPVLRITGGMDLAEPFNMKETGLLKGSVVVIDEEHPGRLKQSTKSYDRRVAGIISGANGVNTGIALRQEGVEEGDQNVALSGRVYVAADASEGAIEPGDLLTTSNAPGCAMKAHDLTRAQGAILGKAMSSLENGKKGYVLVLVTLQ